MTRREVTLGLVAGSAIPATKAKGEVAVDSLQARVAALLDAWVAAWNAADMDAMFRLFTPDAHWVNIVGMHCQGRDEVEHAHRVHFDLMFKGVPTRLEEIESIVPLPAAGAIVVARFSVGAFRTPAGNINPPSHDRMSLVLVSLKDQLLIAHGANVAIVEEAQQFNPAIRRPAQ